MDTVARHELATPRGTAWVDLTAPAGPARCLLVLGHGAGGGVAAPDLRAVTAAAAAAGAAVARVTQPYRVAGRRAPAPAGQLDEAWIAALAALPGLLDPAAGAGGAPPAPPLVVGGRSSGARVACRTAAAVGAAGVVALAFPLHPPGRPERSRLDELAAVAVPALVVNGDRDPFGVPPPLPGVARVIRPGERHDLRGDPPAVGACVTAWLRGNGWLPH
ncbi:alpha/beta hydrolase [Pilimelia terevasa]|uniref:Alpha/beta hydrolase n=1 Tax=Pilimelia terevasa TaxID=53372 RepID=A0A8J3BF53_9ACTN|nr:alpha/beta family hydrolase [Pilimelia terevasa]GGK17381.1 alpha/beta hydrolase [Pilimelia terevasa]